MISFEHVSFSFADELIFHDLNLTIPHASFTGIVGANGAGKTTLIRLLLGLLKPSEGKIVNDEKKIAYVSQTTSLSDSSFPATVEEVVRLGLVGKKPQLFLSHEDKQKLNDVLAEFGLTALRKSLVNELSGGQLQRVKIAKAVIGSPSMIVLDEPDAGMDHESHDKLIELIVALHEKRGAGVIFISHHLHDLERADMVYEVRDRGVFPYSEKEGEHVAL